MKKLSILAVAIALSSLGTPQEVEAKDIVFYCETSQDCSETDKRNKAKQIALQHGSISGLENGTDRVIYHHMDTGYTNMYSVQKITMYESEFNMTYSSTWTSNAQSAPAKYQTYFSRMNSEFYPLLNSLDDLINEYVTYSGGAQISGAPINTATGLNVNDIFLNSEITASAINQLTNAIELRYMGGPQALDALAEILYNIELSTEVTAEVESEINTVFSSVSGSLSSSNGVVMKYDAIGRTVRIVTNGSSLLGRIQVSVKYNPRAKEWKVTKAIDSVGNPIPVDSKGNLNSDLHNPNSDIRITEHNAGTWLALSRMLDWELVEQWLLEHNTGLIPRGIVRVIPQNEN